MLPDYFKIFMGREENNKKRGHKFLTVCLVKQEAVLLVIKRKLQEERILTR